MINVNDEYTLTCIGINNYAKGVAKIDSLLVFVDNFYPDEIARIKITSLKKNLAFGKVIEYIKKSLFRIEDVCHHSHDAGTCPFNNITYEYELELKKTMVLNNINRALDINMKDIEIYSGDIINGYRNKVTIFFNENYKFGYFKEDSNDFLEVTDCVQIDYAILEIINYSLLMLKQNSVQLANIKLKSGIVKGMMIRKSSYTNKISVMFLATKDLNDKFELIAKAIHEKFDNISGIAFNINKEYDTFIYSGSSHQYYGYDAIDEKILDCVFRVNNMSFLQVNTSCATKLYAKAIEYGELTKKDNVLDLYSGAGGISLNLANKVNHVYGIETVKSAVINAKRNAILNDIKNATFYTGDAKDFNRLLENKKIDVLYVDPPRSGLSKETMGEILKQNFKRIVYVSCDSYTMARDLKLLSSKYKLKNISAFNMFPRTRGVECCSVIEIK